MENHHSKGKVKIGIVACASNASNTGRLATLVSVQLLKALGDTAGICSLPAIATNVPRQMNLVKSIPTIIIIDGCHNDCAKKILENAGTNPSLYVNLEYDLGFKKEGPFTTFGYEKDSVEKVVSYILSKIKSEV
jgi:uncharacterized metal-binding protein